METQKVWFPDASGCEGYVLGRIVDIGQDLATVEFLSKPLEDAKVPYNCLLPAGAGDEYKKDVEDNCALMYLNEATLLNNLRIRYQSKDRIYTYVANILIAINPYFEIPNLYTSEAIERYQGKSLGVLPPHVFAIADKAFRDMRALKESQSVIVSGESGAGKTESTKYILRYLCESWGTSRGQIEKLILDANPLLEAFGNAKTIRNNNSSRFGKFIEIHFNAKFTVVGGHISHYLLEKSRICGQGAGERNYHIFYQLCAGLQPSLWQKLKLKNPDEFHYLSRGCTQYFGSKESDAKLSPNRKSKDHLKRGVLTDPVVDDIQDFEATDNALAHFGVSEKDRFEIYKIVAAVLHLGNVGFEESPDDMRGGCRVKGGPSEEALRSAAGLIGIEAEELGQCLLSRIMQTSKGGHKGTVYLVPLKVYEAQNARDALSKAIYSKLFDYLVTRIINTSIPFSQSSFYIGVLDIAGFEYFQSNSFEQFCINYCNEKLQQFFNERILKEEQTIYEREGLGLKHIEYVDNQDCIDLLESKSVGIFDLLDEESKLPKPSPSHFTESVHSNHSGHFRLAVPRKSKLKNHREIRDDEGFLVRHFAGAVCYQTALFIEKNSDALHGSLEGLMKEAQHPLLRALFAVKAENASRNGHSPPAKMAGKLNLESVGGKFRTQLNQLMTKLGSTGTHFIRCVKPNLKMVPHKFEGSHILSQLRCSGMGSVLELMQQGYPSRASFLDLYNMYKCYLPPELARLDARTFCKALFKALGLNEHEFKFGSTKVFFRPGKFAEFDQIMKSDPEHLAQLVLKVRKWLIGVRWKKAQWCALSAVKLKNKILWRKQQIVTIQKNIRMFLATKKFRPRYMGIMRMKKLIELLEEMEPLINELKSSETKRQQSAQMKTLKSNIEFAVKKLKTEVSIKPPAIEQQINEFNASINHELTLLKGKIKEEERLLRLEEEMALERTRKEEEEQKRRQEEEVKQRRTEMERRCEKEAQLKEAQDKAHNDLFGQRPMGQSNEDGAEQEEEQRRLEQERLDHELAMRLTRELGDKVSAETLKLSPMLLPRSAAVLEHRQSQAAKKHDLSKWKYSELRDTINTSCDIDLLEACREEFHRRLKVYHAWKSRNGKTRGEGGQEEEGEERAPQSIMQHASGSRPEATTNGKSNIEQRFFRIPFVRPSAFSGQKGWWFAHFDGQWIKRQMELHPEKPPILLVAGRDDMQMCELSLEETRLTTKRGAEILPEEFEREWTRNSGLSSDSHHKN